MDHIQNSHVRVGVAVVVEDDLQGCFISTKSIVSIIRDEIRYAKQASFTSSLTSLVK